MTIITAKFKKLTAIALTAALLLSLLPVAATTALAADVTFVNVLADLQESKFAEIREKFFADVQQGEEALNLTTVFVDDSRIIERPQEYLEPEPPSRGRTA
ncbi:MAG: hypothetical protein LBT44_09655, partial [Clostridiales bacterium]|nr:hypothetical protein [Clostridiales bacterium]